jgi:NAD(P)H-flavin reductase
MATAEPIGGVSGMIPRLYRLQRMIRETHDTFTLVLVPKNGVEHQPFVAGQFNMLYVFGVGEVPVSISGDPSNQQVLVHTIRSVGAVTKALKKLGRSGSIGLRGPFGSNWPVEEAVGSDVVIVAGGIGLAPLRPAVYKILSQREKYGKVVLLYGARTPADILFRRELERWRSRFDLEVAVTVDRAMHSWRGNVGVVTNLIGKATFDPQNSVAMVCGPEVMMRFTVMELLKEGVAAENVFISMERNMKCAVGFCGHCQYGPTFICKDGPVFRYDRIRSLLSLREI